MEDGMIKKQVVIEIIKGAGLGDWVDGWGYDLGPDEKAHHLDVFLIMDGIVMETSMLREISKQYSDTMFYHNS
jgi:hypothetical protein